MVAQPARRVPTGLVVAGVGISLLVVLAATGLLDPIHQVVESNGFRTTERSYFGVIPHQRTEPVPGLTVQPKVFEVAKSSGIRNMPGVNPDGKYAMAVHIKRGNGDDYYMVSDTLKMSPAEAVKFYRSQVKETRYHEGHSTTDGQPTDTWALNGICPDGKTEFSLKITQQSLGAKDFRYLLEFTQPKR